MDLVLPKLDKKLLIAESLIFNRGYRLEQLSSLKNVLSPRENWDNWSYVVFPINQDNNHWTLAIAHNNGRVDFYDSMGQNLKDERWNLICRILKALKDNNFNPIYNRVNPNSIYQQTDSTSCGVAVCMFAERFLKGESLIFTRNDTFKWRDQAYRLLFDILRKVNKL